MKLTDESIHKITVVVAVTFIVSVLILMSPVMAAELSDFAGQTSGSGRIWWWWK